MSVSGTFSFRYDFKKELFDSANGKDQSAVSKVEPNAKEFHVPIIIVL
jgi:hypothetical protein